MITSQKCRRAKNREAERLMRRSGVIGVGTGEKVSNGEKTGREAVLVFVDKKRPAAQLAEGERVPNNLIDDDGPVETDVIEVGRIKAQVFAHEQQYRPLICGVSCGHPDITAGTAGLIVIKNGKHYILSNNHVLANSNEAKIGDPIYQPGPHDGGGPADRVGTLAEFIPIRFDGFPNAVDEALGLIDAPVASPDDPGESIPDDPPKAPDKPCLCTKLFIAGSNLVGDAFKREYRLQALPKKQLYKTRSILFTDQILNMPLTITGDLASVDAGETIHKSGRTTGYTHSEVISVDAMLNVEYGPGQVARFDNQIMAGAMSAGGDSGSAGFDDDGNLVGLLYAGSDQTTIFNHVTDVFSSLGIEFVYKAS